MAGKSTASCQSSCHFSNGLRIVRLPINIRDTPMPQSVTNEVITMPESSNQNSSPDANLPGHRTTQRASAAEGQSAVEKPPEAPSTEVFAVYGVEPEIQAYAMAKYSRSALSMKESLREISAQKAEKFLNTFYFQYGHRSIADLAHIALAIEKLSILAAIVTADEQRWDGQERSTRYQDFRKSGYYTPDFGVDDKSRELYLQTIRDLFSSYESISETTFRYLVDITP